eukprot:518780_1
MNNKLIIHQTNYIHSMDQRHADASQTTDGLSAFSHHMNAMNLDPMSQQHAMNQMNQMIQIDSMPQEHKQPHMNRYMSRNMCTICGRLHGTARITLCAETESCPGALHDGCINHLFATQGAVVNITCPVCNAPWQLRQRPVNHVVPSSQINRTQQVQQPQSTVALDATDHYQAPPQQQAVRAIVIHPRQPAFHPNTTFRTMHPHQQRAYVMMQNNNVPQVVMNNNLSSWCRWISHFQDLYWKLGNISMAALKDHDKSDIPSIKTRINHSSNGNERVNLTCFQDMVYVNDLEENKTALYALCGAEHYRRKGIDATEIEGMMSHYTTVVWLYFESFGEKLCSLTLLGIKACVVIRKLIFHLNYVHFEELWFVACRCHDIVTQWSKQSSLSRRNQKRSHQLITNLAEWISRHEQAMNALNKCVMENPSECKSDDIQTLREGLMDLFKSMLCLYLKISDQITSLPVPALAEIGLFTNEEFKCYDGVFHFDGIFDGMEMHDDEEQTRFLTERIQYTYKENQEKKTQENNSHKKGTGYQKSRSHRRNRRRRNGRKNGGAMQKIKEKMILRLSIVMRVIIWIANRTINHNRIICRQVRCVKQKTITRLCKRCCGDISHALWTHRQV